MKLFTEAFLDRWEVRTTKRGKRWEKETPPKLVLAVSPDLRLLPTERCTLGLYARSSLHAVFITAVMLAVWLMPLIFLWLRYPFVLHNPRYHKLLIRILSHSGFYIIPWEALFLLVFHCMLSLPRFYFWNRQAERLRREPPSLSEAPVEATKLDAGIWPPPPKRPTD